LASSRNPSKELISYQPPIRITSIRSSCRIGSKAVQLISLGEFFLPFRQSATLLGDINEAYRYPPDTEEKGKLLGNFFQTTAAPPKTAAKVPGTLKEIEAKYTSIKTWGVVGVRHSPLQTVVNPD